MRFSDLNEGPNDPGIFKAVFLAGGPGSGKGYIAQQLGLQARGLKVLNSDDAFEYLMRKRDLSFDMPPEQQTDRDAARQLAKTLTKKKQDIYLDGRLGLIIDGTAKDPDRMAKLKTELEAIGYQTMMVFVNTSLRTALQRNLLRHRKVPTDVVMQSHKQVQTNSNLLADVFSSNYVEIDNNENPNLNEPLKRIDKFISAPVTAQARDWISKAQLQKTVTKEDVGNKPKVYVDMDGVIANFYAGVTAVTGHEEPRAMPLQDIEDTMASFAGTDFFFKLPKYDQADQLIAMVNNMTGGDWYILSSPLKYDREGSAKHKAAWIKKYLNIQPKGMHFTGDKAQFATQPDGTPNILIDDYPKYLNSWKDKGGIGVQYKGHAGNITDVKATLDKHLGDDVDETIRKVKGGYRLLSKKGKNLGTYPSKSGAENREREVQYFKHNESLEEGLVDWVSRKLGFSWGKIGDRVKGSVVADYLSSQTLFSENTLKKLASHTYELKLIDSEQAKKYRNFSDSEAERAILDVDKLDQARQRKITQDTMIKYPPVLDLDGYIWDGNHRIERAVEMGMEKIPVLMQVAKV